MLGLGLRPVTTGLGLVGLGLGVLLVNITGPCPIDCTSSASLDPT